MTFVSYNKRSAEDDKSKPTSIKVLKLIKGRYRSHQVTKESGFHGLTEARLRLGSDSITLVLTQELVVRGLPERTTNYRR